MTSNTPHMIDVKAYPIISPEPHALLVNRKLPHKTESVPFVTEACSNDMVFGHDILVLQEARTAEKSLNTPDRCGIA